MGIFGSRKPYMGAQIREDANAPKLTDLLGQSTGETQMPWADAPQTIPQKRSFFGQGGIGRLIAGSIGDALTQNAGMGTPFQDQQQLRQRQEYEDQLYQRRSADQWAQFVRQQQFRAENPQPTEYERTLVAAGIVPGSKEHAELMRKRALNQSDPPHMVVGENGGPMIVGGSYGYPGATQQDDGYDELPPGYQIGGGEGGPYMPAPTQSTYSNVVDPAGEAAMIKTLGRAGYEQWKRKYGLQVTGNR